MATTDSTRVSARVISLSIPLYPDPLDWVTVNGPDGPRVHHLDRPAPLRATLVHLLGERDAEAALRGLLAFRRELDR